jgi:hypothetical protein
MDFMKERLLRMVSDYERALQTPARELLVTARGLGTRLSSPEATTSDRDLAAALMHRLDTTAHELAMMGDVPAPRAQDTFTEGFPAGPERDLSLAAWVHETAGGMRSCDDLAYTCVLWSTRMSQAAQGDEVSGKVLDSFLNYAALIAENYQPLSAAE